MTRDWLLTLLVAMSPYLLAATIVVLALTRRPGPNERVHRTAAAPVHDGADQEALMNKEPRGHTRPAPPRRQLTYPLHKIVSAVAQSDTDGVVAALDEAGYGRDRVEIITAEAVPGLGEPIGGTGLHGLLTRMQLSMGDDLDELEQARLELVCGHALIQVLVHGDGEQSRVRAILSQHGGHAMRYFGRWAITTLEGDAHVTCPPATGPRMVSVHTGSD